MSPLRITHTSAQGTLLQDSTKGDGAWDAIKAAQATHQIRGWAWSRHVGIYVRHSRDRAPNIYQIERTAEVLREAGFTVITEVDATPRDYAEAEGERAERMDDRAERLTERAARKTAESDGRWAAADAITENIPMGQPILVGHHSERGHRAALKRADGHMRKSVELEAEAKHAQHGADTASRHMDLRENPGRVHRRIEMMEAERRKIDRSLAACGLSGARMKPHMADKDWTCPRCWTSVHIGDDLTIPEHGGATGLHREQLDGQAAHLDNQLTYWRGILAEHRAAGRWNPYSADTIKVGDRIGSWAGRRREVVRVNKKSVTIKDTYGNPNVPDDHPGQWFTRTIKYEDIREHFPAQPPEEPAVDLDAAEPQAVAQ